MKILVWGLRLVVFLLLFVFALQNTEPANVRLLFGQVWQAPLVMVLMLFFAGGALFGVLALLGLVFRQRRELARLKREVAAAQMARPLEPPVPPAA